MLEHPNPDVVYRALAPEWSLPTTTNKREPNFLAGAVPSVQAVIDHVATAFNDYLDSFDISAINSVQAHQEDEEIVNPTQTSYYIDKLMCYLE